jgi:hypothetical protein
MFLVKEMAVSHLLNHPVRTDRVETTNITVPYADQALPISYGHVGLVDMQQQAWPCHTPLSRSASPSARCMTKRVTKPLPTYAHEGRRDVWFETAKRGKAKSGW